MLGNLIFIIVNEGDKMCSNSYFSNDWFYYLFGLKVRINNWEEMMGKILNSG